MEFLLTYNEIDSSLLLIYETKKLFKMYVMKYLSILLLYMKIYVNTWLSTASLIF